MRICQYPNSGILENTHFKDIESTVLTSVTQMSLAAAGREEKSYLVVVVKSVKRRREFGRLTTYRWCSNCDCSGNIIGD
jgi:hypothetical protein